jgi:hypothetical protein
MKHWQNWFCFCLKIIFNMSTTIFSTFHSTSTPICHPPAAGAKRRFHENGLLRSKDVASDSWNVDYISARYSVINLVECRCYFAAWFKSQISNFDRSDKLQFMLFCFILPPNDAIIFQRCHNFYKVVYSGYFQYLSGTEDLIRLKIILEISFRNILNGFRIFGYLKKENIDI